MADRYEKKTTYEYCRTRGMMVKLEVIKATLMMPDMVHAEMRVAPTDCNRAAECKREGIRCLVYDEHGIDPCPDAWKSDW